MHNDRGSGRDRHDAVNVNVNVNVNNLLAISSCDRLHGAGLCTHASPGPWMVLVTACRCRCQEAS